MRTAIKLVCGALIVTVLGAESVLAEVICNKSYHVTNVRKGPSAKNYNVVDSLPNGTAVKILKKVTNAEGYHYLKVIFKHSNSEQKIIGYIYFNNVASSCSLSVAKRKVTKNSTAKKEVTTNSSSDNTGLMIGGAIVAYGLYKLFGGSSNSSSTSSSTSEVSGVNSVSANKCYYESTCFNIVRQKGNKLTVRCKQGSSSAGQERTIFQCKDGGWDSGGFTTCVGVSSSMKTAGNAVCGRY